MQRFCQETFRRFHEHAVGLNCVFGDGFRIRRKHQNIQRKLHYATVVWYKHDMYAPARRKCSYFGCRAEATDCLRNQPVCKGRARSAIIPSRIHPGFASAILMKWDSSITSATHNQHMCHNTRGQDRAIFCTRLGSWRQEGRQGKHANTHNGGSIASWKSLSISCLTLLILCPTICRPCCPSPAAPLVLATEQMSKLTVRACPVPRRNGPVQWCPASFHMSIGQNSLHLVMDAGVGGVAS